MDQVQFLFLVWQVVACELNYSPSNRDAAEVVWSARETKTKAIKKFSSNQAYSTSIATQLAIFNRRNWRKRQRTRTLGRVVVCWENSIAIRSTIWKIAHAWIFCAVTFFHAEDMLIFWIINLNMKNNYMYEHDCMTYNFIRCYAVFYVAEKKNCLFWPTFSIKLTNIMHAKFMQWVTWKYETMIMHFVLMPKP